MILPEDSSQSVLRIIDANLDRIGEGLRVLEDLARFALADAALSLRLKNMRHELLTSAPSPQELLGSRDASGDVGADIETPDQKGPRDVPATVTANARRVQEALRVMEEMSRHINISPEKYRKARFDLYELEKILLSRLLRHDKLQRLPGLYVIIDTPALQGRSHTETARQAIRGGATTIQLRDKMTGKRELLQIARQLKALCAELNTLFIVNDHLDLALASSADGLHLGQEDLPVDVARGLLGIDQILGISTRTPEQAVAAAAQGADYIAVGAMYATQSREAAEVVGPERLRQIRQEVSLPLVAIGGITAKNAGEVIAGGADALAVISAVLAARDVAAAARDIATRCEVEK